MKMDQKRIQKNILLLLVAVLYLLFFSAFTSPLFPKYLNYDSAIFMMVGKGILAGKELYVDIFDHKGPVLFWLEALGMLGGRAGIFLLQTLFLWIDLMLLDRIMDLFDGGKTSDSGQDELSGSGVAGKYQRSKCRKKWLVTVMTLALLSYPFANGNLSEEYSLPFIFLSLYLFLCDRIKRERPTVYYSYVYGLCLGILAFIRLNNAVTVCGIILYWIIVLLRERKGKELVRNIGVGLLGIATVTLPVVLVFAVKGSLYEMFYATFLFNMRYSSHMSFLQRLTNLNTLAHMAILFTPLLAAMLVFFVRLADRKLTAALWLIMALNIVSLFMGNGYNHYFTITVPLEALMCICMVFPAGHAADGTGILKKENSEKGRQQRSRRLPEAVVRIGFAGVLAAYCILAARIVILNGKDYYVDAGVVREYDTVQNCLAQIPEEDRANVLGYNAPAKYYLMGGLLPCFRYGILQENWSINDADIMAQTVRYIAEGDVRWVITEAGCDNREVLRILSERFVPVEENVYCCLYRRK